MPRGALNDNGELTDRTAQKLIVELLQALAVQTQRMRSAGPGTAREGADNIPAARDP